MKSRTTSLFPEPAIGPNEAFTVFVIKNSTLDVPCVTDKS